MSNIVLNSLWLYLGILNLLLFFVMFYDKRQAIKKRWRVPEINLLLMGFIGGGFGGLLAQRIFHHKSKKMHFYIVFSLGSLIALLLVYTTYSSLGKLG